ncbi:hypothetical protein Cgig2_009170 [Carnegiea gigantea]|uniref:Uncharacterized protein n=1 Tax=Carnegiea gigantea TaxID=171969 RepID=A0A9Q1KF64_9CARY|nr:hypothetical protein Cgig2_009170 [Carnegiea gigantea]
MICWYFTDSWEQFRINGMVDVIDGSDPDPAKLQCSVKTCLFSNDSLGKPLPEHEKDKSVEYTLTSSSQALQQEEDVMQQREKSWFASSLRSRMQYLGPDLDLPSIKEELPKNISLDPSVSPVGAFCLLVLDPEKSARICKCKAEPSMLDMVTTKGNVQREGTRNGGNVSP